MFTNITETTWPPIKIYFLEILNNILYYSLILTETPMNLIIFLNYVNSYFDETTKSSTSYHLRETSIEIDFKYS